MLDTPSALADGVAAEAKYPWLPFSVSISYTLGTLSQEDDDNATILNSKELSLVDASNDHQATCSEIEGLRTLDDLKCGFELELMGKRHLDERA